MWREELGQEMADAKTDIVDKILAGEIDPDEIFTCDAFATSTTPRKRVTAEKLNKVWRISLKDAKQTLNVTSQHCKRSEDRKMSRQYSESMTNWDSKSLFGQEELCKERNSE